MRDFDGLAGCVASGEPQPDRSPPPLPFRPVGGWASGDHNTDKIQGRDSGEPRPWREFHGF